MNKLEFYRKQKGLSREELADRVGLSVETITAIESGIEVPTSTKPIAKIAETLGREPSENFCDYKMAAEAGPERAPPLRYDLKFYPLYRSRQAKHSSIILSMISFTGSTSWRMPVT